MTQSIAIIAIVVAMGLNMLGNFYFTYGIWPKSWSSFAFFMLVGVILNLVFDGVRKEIRPK